MKSTSILLLIQLICYHVSHMIENHILKLFICYFVVMIDVMLIHNLIDLLSRHVMTELCKGIP